MQLATTEALNHAVSGYVFGDVHLDLQGRRLVLCGAPKSIERQTFEFLVYLIARRHRVVTKQELHDSLWYGRAICEGALPQCVWTARKAMGGGEFRQTFIRTVHGVGYQFVGPVTEHTSFAGHS
jgi:DNA-binding winged helix-turn-helix (wHTH) protein